MVFIAVTCPSCQSDRITKRGKTDKTICFSKSIQMPNMVIGLVVNRDEFGWRVSNHDIQIWNTTEKTINDWLMNRATLSPQVVC